MTTFTLCYCPRCEEKIHWARIDNIPVPFFHDHCVDEWTPRDRLIALEVAEDLVPLEVPQ